MEQLLAVIDQNNTADNNHQPGAHRPRSIVPGLCSDYDDNDSDQDELHLVSSPKIACRPAPKTFEPGPALIDDAGEGLYVVAAIIDCRLRNRRYEYLVDWEGYGPEHRSWEPASELKQHAAIREMIQDFHDDHPDRPKPGTKRQKRRKTG